MSSFEFENLKSETKKPDNKSFTGKVLIAITGGVAVGLSVVCASFVRPAFRKFCLPYIPATDTQIKNVLTALKSQRDVSSVKSNKLLDLGSGDGRIVFETAKHNFQSHGVELNPWLVIFSKFDALRRGCGKTTQFFQRDLWKFNVSRYNYIVIFGVDQMMSELENKFLKECNDCNIVACRFKLPNLMPIKTVGEGVDTVWLYEIRKSDSRSGK